VRRWFLTFGLAVARSLSTQRGRWFDQIEGLCPQQPGRAAASRIDHR
jgi:hypothetical protein